MFGLFAMWRTCCCVLYSRAFGSNASVRQHMRDRHGQCHICGYVGHEGDECNSVECDVCGKVIQSSSCNYAVDMNNLRVLERSHRARNMACSACGEIRFNSIASVTAHFENGICTTCANRDAAEVSVYKLVQ